MGKKKGNRRDDDDPFADLGEDVSQNNVNEAPEDVDAEKQAAEAEAAANKAYVLPPH